MCASHAIDQNDLGAAPGTGTALRFGSTLFGGGGSSGGGCGGSGVTGMAIVVVVVVGFTTVVLSDSAGLQTNKQLERTSLTLIGSSVEWERVARLTTLIGQKTSERTRFGKESRVKLGFHCQENLSDWVNAVHSPTSNRR